jgi:hypothetical protein
VQSGVHWRNHGEIVRRRGIVVWGWIAWSIVVLAVWVAVAAFVGVLIGRAVRRRDKQVPTSEIESFPAPRTEAEGLPPVSEHRPQRP